MVDVKDKIRKLLSLATSPNENEAKAALLKAKELMIANKLSEADFEEEKVKELVHLAAPQVKWTTDSGDSWAVQLADMMCANYCCVAAWMTPRGSRTHTLQITGMQDDAEVCKAAIEYAFGFITGKVKVLQRRYKTTDPRRVRLSYASGFIAGLELAFDLQKEEHQEWGLVAVEPEEVKQFKDSLGSKTVTTRKSSIDPMSYITGQKDGSEFSTKRVLA